MSQLVILLSIFIAAILNATPIDFTCNNGAACSCSNGDCRHMCLSNECVSKYFMCRSSATSCIVDCYGTHACKDTKIYGAADTVILNCNGTNSCDGTQLLCGRPNSFPNNYLSRTYNTNQFNGQIKDCFVNLLTPNAMSFGDVTCDGSITNCIIEAYDYNSISQSLFECKIANTNGNGCELNCLQDSNCDSIDFKCNTLSHCSCGIIDKNCDNSNVYLTTEESQTGNIIEKSNQYNCVDLVRTEVKIKSALKTNRNIGQGKEATFNYQICGKDFEHNTISFRYKYESEDINKHSLSGSLHDIHHSVYFIEHEENGAIYDFEWEFNIPNIICWLTNELYAFKIDLYYDKNVSFAFTYLYSEDMKSNNKEQLTARNLWNKQLTSLEEGYIYFNYHYNITLYNPETMSPTDMPTIIPTSNGNIIIIPSQTAIDDENNLVTIVREESEETTTTSYLREGRVIETTNSNSNINMDDENVKIKTNNTNETPIKGLLFGISLVAVLSICCIIACIIYHQKKRQNEGMEAAYASAAGGDSISDDDENNEADIDDTDININELPNERMSSGILDENDLSDINQNINQKIKKYIKRDPSNIIPGKEQSESHSESGIGYISKNKQLLMNDDDDDDESLIVRDRDISMDAEYHHVITHQPEISIMQEEEILNRVNIREDSISKQKQKQKEREISISQSMSRLSQSLSIPPIELNEEITNVKTYKTKTTVQSAAASMKLFSQKIAKAAVKFGHNPLNPHPQSTSSINKMDNKIDNNNEYATMVIYKNESTSKIPQSQIKTSTTPPPITSIDIVNTKFLNPQSTQTMIVKNLYDDSNDSLDDYSNDSNDSNDRDPIDVSEEDDIIQMKRHKKNLSNVSNKSYHDRRTMIINDDLTINHLVNSIEEDDEQHQQH